MSQSPYLLPILRGMRHALYAALTPLDSAFRRVNRLGQYPPLHLRRHVGTLGGGFNGAGYEFVAYLRLLAGLRDSEAVWDLACGCGLLELALEELGWRGPLLGTDIHQPCIAWARRHISPRVPSFRFQHSDIYHDAYWRRGKLDARQWLAQFNPPPFDVVVAKSLFTHLLPDECQLYLDAIAQRLKSGGRTLLTFFLLSDAQRQCAAAGRNQIAFQPYADDGRCAVRSALAPTAAVAYEQSTLETWLRQAGFLVEELSCHPGVWSGRADGLSFQDVVVVRKA